MEMVTGIQQVGIGVASTPESKLLYKELFGMNVLVFEDSATAAFMKQYTGNEEHRRHAVFSLNMQGGGGFEIWQFTSRTPSVAEIPAQAGDLGIYAIKIKTRNVRAAHAYYAAKKGIKISPLLLDPEKRYHFWIQDPHGNHFDMVEGDDWFHKNGSLAGGVAGAVIGVNDMQKALHFYKKVLGIDEEVYHRTGPAPDLCYEGKEGHTYHRVLLRKKVSSRGAFSQLLGSVQIELIQILDHKPRKIYANRYWGDCGFMHLCFDVLNMDLLKQQAAEEGYFFSVDSAGSFTMGASAGRFCYVEDPDGTLIELVETHKVPIFKKMGWYLDLKKRRTDKPLPHWMIRVMGLSKV